MDVRSDLRVIHTNFNWKHASLLLTVLFAALYPLFRHVVDIDAIGYITVARHYATGDWHDAINGYWSPLNSWLMVPFVSMGFNGVMCFKIANLVFAIGALYQAQRLLRQFSFTSRQHSAILLTAMIMVLSYAMVQLAADMLFVWIFLWYVNEATHADLVYDTKLNARLGLIAVIGFFAKTYGGVFFVMHFSFLHLFWVPLIQRKGWHLKNYSAGMLAFLPLVLVWMALLFHKYHIISFGYSGQLNWSWVLKGGQPDYQPFFYPPPYAGATSRWVDPFYSQATLSTPFQSKELLVKGLRLVGFNIKNAFWSTLWTSILSPVLLGWLLVKVRMEKSLIPFTTIIILFPLVYLLIFVEERYLWPLSILLLIASCVLLHESELRKKWIWGLLLLSFIPGPVIRMADAAGNDKEVALLTNAIQEQQLKGPFTSTDSGEWMHKAAFLTGNVFYGIVHPFKRWEDLEIACKAIGIKTICIGAKNRDEAIQFLSSAFYNKYQQSTSQIEGRYLWVTRL
ncbi:MAG: hypothetical protein ABIX01_23065 [Chitinophagaceae bacterium]